MSRPGWPALPLLLLLLLAGAAAPLPGQTDGPRPRVGLVLSGGGAKGFAHIGVLQVLERAGIRPDYITGTSMGSIVGGLYAMGYSPDTLEQIALAQDWDRVLSDNIPLREVLYEEKPYFKYHHLELPIDSSGPRTPEGLIQGHEIERLLNRLTLPAYRIASFDELPTPFRCMAVDLYYGTPYELSEGSLGRAIRASMAIPTVFSPVRQDTLFLVDGGVIRNFPVQEVKALGADLIIGVYAGPRLTPREELEGVQAVLGQTLFLGSLADSETQVLDVDVYIEPEIAPYNAASFGSADSIIARGVAAGEALWPRLRALADSLDRLGPPPGPPPLTAIDSIRLDEVRVSGNNIYSKSEILDQAGLAPGQYIRPDDLDRAMTTLFGTNHFAKVTYQMRWEGGRSVLEVECLEKANLLIKGTVSYDSYHEIGIGLNLTMRNVLLPASRMMAVAKIANNHRYRFEYLKYIDRAQTRWLDARLQFNVDRIPIIDEGRLTAEYRLVDIPFDLWVRQRRGANLVFGLGLRLERLRLSPTITETPLFDNLRFLNLNLLAGLAHNSLDRNVMPRRGHRFELEAAWVSGVSASLRDPAPGLEDELGSLTRFDPYPRLNFRSEHYFPTGARGGVVARPFAGLILTGQPLLADFVALGGPVAVSRRSLPAFGLEVNELGVQAAFGSSLGYQHFLFDVVRLALDATAGFYGSPDPDGSTGMRSDNFFLGAGLSAGYDSLIGPLSLTMMLPFTDDDAYRSRFKVFLEFGYRF